MKKLLTTLGLVLLCGSAFAQNTVVSGTTKDSAGVPYSYGTVLITLSSTNATCNGLGYNPPSLPLPLDSTGAFTVSLCSNTNIKPASTTYSFKVCSQLPDPIGGPPIGTGQQCFTSSGITVGGATQSISTTLQSAATALTNISASAGSAAFNAITGGTNTTAAMVVGSGAHLTPTGTGVLAPTPIGTGTLFYVTDPTYGAKCDGSTDDTTAIQAAITAAQGVASAATVVFPNGICQISSALTITASYVSLQGQNQGATCIRNTSTSADTIDITGTSSSVKAQYNQINNLCLLRSSSGTGTSSGLKLTNAQWTSINYVYSADSINLFNNASADANILYSHCIAINSLGGTMTNGWLLSVGGSTYIEDSVSLATSGAITNAINLVASSGVRDVWADRFNVGTGGGTITSTGSGVITDVHFVNLISEPGGSVVAINLSSNTSSGGVFNQIEFVGTHIKSSSANAVSLSGVSGVQMTGGEITIGNTFTGVALTSSSTGNTFSNLNFSCATGSCTPMSFDNTSSQNVVTNIVNNTASNISDANGTNYNVFALAQGDPTKYIWFFDDFLSWALANYTANGYVSTSGSVGGGAGPGVNWYISLTGSSTASGQATWDAGSYGVVVLATGTSSGNNIGLFAGLSSTWVLNATTFEWKERVKLGQTTTVKFGVGLMDAVGDSASSNYIGIAYDTVQSDTGWMCVTKSAGTATRTAVTGTLDTNYHTFRIWSSTAGTINCSVDNGAATTISTNVPSAAGNMGTIIQTATTSAENTHIDYVRFWEAISTR